MSLDSELRAALAEQADRREGPVADLAAIRAGGLSRRRRHRRLVLASSGMAILFVVGVGLGVAERLRTTSTDELLTGPPLGAGQAPEVPWCVPDPSGGQLIVGEGAPIHTLCHGARGVHLWHHAGTTILTKIGSTFQVADGGLTPLGTSDGNVSMSHDGRLAAWLGLSGGTNCGLLPLQVYEVRTATEVAARRFSDWVSVKVSCWMSEFPSVTEASATVSDGRAARIEKLPGA